MQVPSSLRRADSTSPRNIVVCCDGYVRRGYFGESNITAIYRSLVDDEGQRSLYLTTTARSTTAALRGSFFGYGFRVALAMLYQFLAENVHPGDRLFLFGFSKGGFLVNSVAQLLAKCGLVKEVHPELLDTALDLYFDTRQAAAVDFKRTESRECTPHLLGVIESARFYGLFHSPRVDRVLPPDIPFAYHALALDERARFFGLQFWSERRKPADQTIQQVWFPGGHPDLGGLVADKGLSDGPLEWLLGRAEDAGLRLAPDWRKEVRPDPVGGAVHHSPWSWRLIAPFAERPSPVPGSLMHHSVDQRRRLNGSYGPELPDKVTYVGAEGGGAEDARANERERRLEELREQIKQTPDKIELWVEMAEVLRELGRKREYVDALNEVDRLEREAAFERNVGAEIRLTRAEVQDLDFFGTFDWRFSPRMNVMLGKNGYGKSHFYALLVALLQFDKKKAGDFIGDESQSGARASLFVDKEGEPHEVRYTKVGFEQNTIGRVPVLAISELRFIDKSRNDFGKEDLSDFADFGDLEDLKANGAWHFLNSRPLGPIIQNFIARVGQESLRKKTLELPIIELYHEVVRRLTSSEFRIESIEPIPNSARLRIRVLTEGNDRPVLLQHASQGTLSIMAMVSLIFDFLSSLYPDVPPDEVAGRPAIVFIDELDAHMHPSWQRKILGILRDSFPAVQFFVAAHSPLVVAGCKRGEVAVLRRRRESPGFRLEQIERHFVGATTSELYSSIFEVEEKDETYLKYATMHPFKEEIEQEARQLEKKLALGEEEETELAELTAKQRALDHKLALASHLLDKAEREAKEEKTLHMILEEAGVGPSDDDPAAALAVRLVLSAEERSRLEELQGERRLPPEESRRLHELREDLYYLGEFERIEERRRARRMHEREVLLDLQERLTEEVGEQETSDG